MKSSILLFILLPLLVTACGTSPEPKSETNKQKAGITNQPSNQASVTSPETEKPRDAKGAVFVKAEKAEIKAGGAGEATFVVTINEPFHINANPPTDKNLIPTEIKFEAQNGVTAGKPVYPKGDKKSFTFNQGKELSVYTGEVTIKMPLKVAAGTAKGEQILNAKLRFQPCDDEVCYPPKEMDFVIPLMVQ
jgi:thiol:disulfide interchange protein DsbD